MTYKNIYNRFFWLYVEFFKKWYDNTDHSKQSKQLKRYKTAIINYLGESPISKEIIDNIRKNAKKDAENYVY